ncbi:syndecan-4 [Gouania willdenowi]|uniref:Syndecan n=1 Tax=Gouania willdenowi TaxID=441366 RepID=A0A8C5DRB0_GOUWI|nr:syndecan-4-like [Gouania willdenowi]
MLSLGLVFFLSVSVFSESVRETETWMPLNGSQTVALSAHVDDQESSGNSNGSDFGFTDDYDDTLYDDEDEDVFSGSGDEDDSASPDDDASPSVQPGVRDNNLPEQQRPLRPTLDELEIISNSNEIPSLSKEGVDEHPSNVLMSHANDDSVFNKTEVLAALIAGGAVGLLLAVLLVLLLVYRMKKKDEGSYEVGKKPIYIKAPTTEIYA